MKRLIDHGLRYGNLFRVHTPVMRTRYNAALAKLTGKTTDLEDFQIDISGYSPDVGDAFSDPLYLNPHGCNRQFILLSVEQRKCPLIDAQFSTSRSILRRFIDDNFAQLTALTARDAVIGELDNSTWRIDDIEDLVTIRKINVRVESTRRLIGKAEELKTAIGKFHESETDWYDDAVLARMCVLADAVGDIKRHSILPGKTTYRQGNFHTSHFGGLYVFRNIAAPAVISCDPEFDLPVPEPYAHIRLDDRAGLSRFLFDNRLVENVLDLDWLDHKTLLQDRMDFMLIDLLSALVDAPDLSIMRRADFRRAARWHLGELPGEFESLSDAVRCLEQNLPVKAPQPDDHGHFYLLRAAQSEDRDLVNHLLARMTPLDFRQLFICNKEIFYQNYQAWPDGKREFVSAFLAETYVPDKQAAREELYGEAQRPVARPWGGSPKARSAVEGALKFVDSQDWTGGQT